MSHSSQTAAPVTLTTEVDATVVITKVPEKKTPKKTLSPTTRDALIVGVSVVAANALLAAYWLTR